MTEILAYRILIVVLAVMACAWARCARHQSAALRSAFNQMQLGKTAVDWLRGCPEALALLTAHRTSLSAKGEELSAEADAADKAGRLDAPANLLLLAMIAQLESENVCDLIRAATK